MSPSASINSCRPSFTRPGCETATAKDPRPLRKNRAHGKIHGEVGATLGTWDVGPFGNDDAADFGGELDDAPAQARIEMVGAVLECVANPADEDSRLADAPRAIAAAALIAAQCPGGAPITSVHGPATPMPEFPGYLRSLAVDAPDRVIMTPTWSAEDWDATHDGPAWRRTVSELREELDPSQRESLFDL